MTIVKHSKESSLQQLPKKRFPSLISLVPAILLALSLGTYLDLFFIGKGFYSFPSRPMPEIFSIHIAFTLLGLPLFSGIFLYICSILNRIWQKTGVIVIVSLMMAVFEKQAEAFGLFTHHQSWKHIYSFGGYIVFLTIIYIFNNWMEKKRE